MEKVESKIKAFLTSAIIACIGLAGGIPCIVFGAVSHIWALLGVGVAFVAFGFYGTPILFIKFGEYKALKRIVIAIDKEHLYTLNEIASQIGRQTNETDNLIKRAIAEQYLTGYKYNDGIVTVNYNKRPENPYTVESRCPYCGAPVKIDPTKNGPAYCEYCGTIIKK